MTSSCPADEKRSSSHSPASSSSSSISEPDHAHDHDQSVKPEELTNFEPIISPDENSTTQTKKQSSNLNTSTKSNTTRSLERCWSLNDGTSLAGDEGVAERVGSSDEERDVDGVGFTVGWDENDRLNPRNMSKARRWMVTIIVSMGSLCV